ncbi:MAG TPA: hypothetical protein VMN99_11125 [Anaerolineales bacterium]|nr:hypothetical protein [Anaerolineales bacterium]
MKANLEKLRTSLSSPRSVPIVLFIVAALTYGLFFWERGFYWDESPWTWIYYRLGPDALTKTFSTSRPFWGMIYQVTMPLLGPHPWRWQLLVVILRWLTAVLVWMLLRQVWRRDERPALWGSLLFLVYPGLGQNFISLMYSHFYIVLNCFLFSLYLSILAIRQPDRRVPLTVAALAFSFVNLLTMEYFYFLEFLRIVLFWIVVNDEWKQKIRRVIILFIPYFAVMLGITFWRLFFFENQNASYSYVTLDLLRKDPLLGISTLLKSMFMAFWETVPHAWLFPFESVSVDQLGLRVSIVAAVLILVSMILIAFYLLFRDRSEQGEHIRVGQMFLLGFAAWLFAGGSFWLVGIEPQLHFSADRFTLPFMLGSSLILVALISLLNARPRLQYGLLALLVAFSIGKQFETNIAYIRDWDVHRDLFWQMSWRIPALEPNTAIVSNDLPVNYFSDNSLSGPLNWIYGRTGEMDHILYFISIRLNRGLPDLEPGLAIEQNYLAKTFRGNTSQLVVIDYSPPGCVRVLDPQIDPANRLLVPLLRDAAVLSNTSMIHEENAVNLPDSLFAPEPAHAWCYYFEKADLARQFGDWEKVAELGDIAFKLDDHPNDPVERFVFIEGYAHMGDWERALKLSRESYRVSKDYVGPLLCRLWERIETETTGDLPSGRSEALSEIKSMLACKS